MNALQVTWGTGSKRAAFYIVVGRLPLARDNIQPGDSRTKMIGDHFFDYQDTIRGRMPKAGRYQYIHVQIKTRVGGRPISNGSITGEPCSQQRKAS